MESVFDEAVSNYERSVPTWSGNSDFGRMLQRLAYQLPKEKVRDAPELFDNVQTTPFPFRNVGVGGLRRWCRYR